MPYHRLLNLLFGKTKTYVYTESLPEHTLRKKYNYLSFIMTEASEETRTALIDNMTTSEPVQEYLNMDKITLVKMLLASKEENKKLHDKLDKLRKEAQEREAKAEEREAKAEARNEELMRANRRQMEYQVKLMDQLTEMQRQ